MSVVISAEGPTTTSSSPSTSSAKRTLPLTVGPLPPPSDFTFSVSKPRSKRHPLKFDDSAEPRPWNLRSRNGSFSFDPNERTRFSVALSGDEIAEDIYAVTGSLPRRRPKKRPRLVQKQIDMVFPGTWLTEITLELYKLPHDR